MLMTSEESDSGALRNWRVQCGDCGADYTPKSRKEPTACYQCHSTNIQCERVATDGGSQDTEVER